MPRKDFSADALDAFELERPKAAARQTAAPMPALVPMTPDSPAPAPIQSASAPAHSQEELIRRTYYISPAQHKALKVRAATSDKSEEKDISKIVRAAIDQYLARN